VTFVPHFRQNVSSEAIVAPQFWHGRGPARAPHFRQNRSSAASGVPHEAHAPACTAMGAAPEAAADAGGTAAVDHAIASPSALRWACRADTRAAV